MKKLFTLILVAISLQVFSQGKQPQVPYRTNGTSMVKDSVFAAGQMLIPYYTSPSLGAWYDRPGQSFGLRSNERLTVRGVGKWLEFPSFTEVQGMISAVPQLTFSSGLQETGGVVKLGLDLSTAGSTNKGLLTESLYLVNGDFTGTNYRLLNISTAGATMQTSSGESLHNLQALPNAAELTGNKRGVNNIQSYSRASFNPFTQTYGAGIGVTDTYLSITREALSSTAKMAFNDIAEKGVTYASDYSVKGLIDDRWIPDLGAVKGLIATKANKTGEVGYIQNISTGTQPSSNFSISGVAKSASTVTDRITGSLGSTQGSINLSAGVTIGRSGTGNNVALVVTQDNPVATGDIQNWYSSSTLRAKMDYSGILSLYTAPTTSAATYDLLTRNIATGTVEKVLSSTFATSVALGAKQNLITLTTIGAGAATFNQSTGALNIPISSSGGSGTVTNVSSANANITVATGSTTPVLTLASTITSNTSGNAATATAVGWPGITSKPTTLAGYGITNAVNTTGDQTEIAGNKTWTGEQKVTSGGGSTNWSTIGGTSITVAGGTGTFFTQIKPNQIAFGQTSGNNGFLSATTLTATRDWLLPNAGGTIALTSQFESGTYSPTMTEGVNVVNVTNSKAFYIRVGNIVTVTGTALISSTATGTTSFKFSLPIPSTDVAGMQGTGLIAVTDSGTLVLNSTISSTIGGTARIAISYTATAITPDYASIKYTYSYSII